MVSPPITSIFFDAAGTLFTVNGSVGEIYARLACAHGKEVAVKDLEVGFRRCFASAPPMAFPGAAPSDIFELEKKWWRDVVQAVFTPLGPFPRFLEYFDTLFAYFARTEAWQLYPETISTLTTLHDRGFRMGVISNFDARLFAILEGFGIMHFFDPIVISTRAGAAKPQVAIFAQALARHHLKPDEALHVGDSQHADITGAQAAGMVPVFVDRRNGTIEAASSLRVRNLAELLTLDQLRSHQ